MAPLKIGIVGSGASAVGVLSGLDSLGIEAEITIFSTDRYFASSPKDRYSAGDPALFYASVYADLRKRSIRYPPQKTFFGDGVPCYTVDAKRRFFKIEMFGGQTNIWGGTVLPFPREEFSGWPISRRDLEPHYEAIADVIGVAGAGDRLSGFLGLDYSNRPPARQLRGSKALEAQVNSHAETELYRFHAGMAPTAVDTGPRSESSCIQCGECMVGCIRDSIYASATTIRRYLEKGQVAFVGHDVRSLSSRGDGVELRFGSGRAEVFSKVFLCAGCVGTTELLMRSLDLRSGPKLQDNALYQFPVINFSKETDEDKEHYFGLANLLLLLEPKHEGVPLLQIQVYPNVDYLWRSILPRWAWGVGRHPVRWSRDRLMWARAYMDAEDSYSYAAAKEGDRVVFTEESGPNRAALARTLASLRRVLRGSRFFVPRVPPVCAHTSAHLAGTFPYGGGVVPVARDGEVIPNVHIADSSCFPKSSVVSPTLTIMANARRTAVEALRP